MQKRSFLASRLIIFTTLSGAYLLQLLPCSKLFYCIGPTWSLLTLLYWVMAVPRRVNIGVGFMVGLLEDVGQGTVLGIHALLFSLFSYYIAHTYQLLRAMPLWQQAIMVVVYTSSIQLIAFMLQSMLCAANFSYALVGRSVANAFVWPGLFLFLRKLRRQYQIR